MAAESASRALWHGDERGLRQYHKAYISTGKQNGKSYMLGGLPIYHLLMEDEANPTAYGVASAKDQAGIVYDAAIALVKINPLLLRRFKIRESTHRLILAGAPGIYEVLAADGDVNDGKRGSLLLFDELHRFKTKKAETVRDVLKKGQVSRMPIVNGVRVGEPLSISITTSGDEFESPLWASEYDYACKVR
jgi:phage terminase large subunit-like protein